MGDDSELILDLKLCASRPSFRISFSLAPIILARNNHSSRLSLNFDPQNFTLSFETEKAFIHHPKLSYATFKPARSLIPIRFQRGFC